MLSRSYSLRRSNQKAIVRQATEDDFSETWAIYRAVLSEGLYTPSIRGETSLERYERLSSAKDGGRRFITLLCEVGGKAAGYATVEDSIWDLSQHVGELGIAVLPEFRGIGIGSALLDSILAAALEKGFKKVVLSVFDTNRRAIRLYSKFGFKKVGRKKKQFNVNGHYVDEIIMEKFIGDIPD